MKDPLNDKEPLDGEEPSGVDELSLGETEDSAQTPRRWPALVDELIEEAMRDGAFDNLPGRGQPLELVINPYAGDADLAHQLLKNNDYTLPWIAERKAIFERIEELRKSFRHTWQRYEADFLAARDTAIQTDLLNSWGNSLDLWVVEIDKLNKLIAGTNLKQPGEKLEILKLTLGDELRRAGAKRELG